MFENIADNDLLGRAVFSSRCAKKAKNLKSVDFRSFFKKGSNNISVDLFGFCTFEELTGIQDKNAKLRSTKIEKRSFYGWLKMAVSIVRCRGRIVKAAPTRDNPCHANIILPASVKDDFERRAHAVELAANRSIEWVSRSDRKY